MSSHALNKIYITPSGCEASNSMALCPSLPVGAYRPSLAVGAADHYRPFLKAHSAASFKSRSRRLLSPDFDILGSCRAASSERVAES